MGRGSAILTPNELVLTFDVSPNSVAFVTNHVKVVDTHQQILWVLTSVPILVKIDQEMRS